MQLSRRLRPLVKPVCALLPGLVGKPITIQLQAVGEAVHAGADIRKRVIALDPALAEDPDELARILIHEIFHFAWVRLGNVRRKQYAAIIARELTRGARGELGWSSEYRKANCRADSLAVCQWSEYICESFCDTAAWRYAGLPDHDEFTLPKRYREARERWFSESFGDGPISI